MENNDEKTKRPRSRNQRRKRNRERSKELFDRILDRSYYSIRWGLIQAAGWIKRLVVFVWCSPLWIKMKVSAVVAFILLIVMTPSMEGGAETLQLPVDGTTVSPAKKLEDGKLYKLIVSGSYLASGDGKRSDAQYKTSSDPFDTIRDSIEVNGELLDADLYDRDNHTYTYYVAGNDRRISIRLVDKVFGGIIEGGYLDNSGVLEMTLVEADFRFYVSDDVETQSKYCEFFYTLDPIPREGDIVTLEIFKDEGGGRKTSVFIMDSDRFVDDSQAAPSRLTKSEQNSIIWYGYGNQGQYLYEQMDPGIYFAQLTVRSGDDIFSAFPPDIKRDYVTIAVLPSDSDPRMNTAAVIPQGPDNNPFFPYYSPRARHPILGPIDGIEGIYVADTEINKPGFLYYGETNRAGEPIVSPAVLYLKRMINLTLDSYDECDTSYRYDPSAPISGVYDKQLIDMLIELRTRLPYDTAEEEALLSDIDNLPPGVGIAASETELGYIAGAPTIEHLMNLTLQIPGVPVALPLREFDNFKAYDPDDPYHSLYHTMVEIGTRINGESKRFSFPPENPELIRNDKYYDISDDDFISLMMTVCYQECGLIHATKSGQIYKAGKGRGSATGYMQCTADVIRGTNYKMTYPSDDGLISFRLNRLPSNSRYAVRNVARFNIEIGSSFLREMVNQPHAGWHKEIKRAMRGDGNLSFATQIGTINRVKLTGAMYNAGPGSMKVMIHEMYDDPTTSDINESVEIFVYEYECDTELFVERFRADLAAYAEGTYHFPVEKRGAAGRTRLIKLIHWLGPYWVKKKAPISWETAALMKLDIEVIPYTYGLAMNFLKFQKYKEHYFMNQDFSTLWQRPKRKDKDYSFDLRPYRGITLAGE